VWIVFVLPRVDAMVLYIIGLGLGDEKDITVKCVTLRRPDSLARFSRTTTRPRSCSAPGAVPLPAGQQGSGLSRGSAIRLGSLGISHCPFAVLYQGHSVPDYALARLLDRTFPSALRPSDPPTRHASPVLFSSH
jgi:hypothetical protein